MVIDALSMVSLGGVPSTFGDFISEGLVAKPTTGLLNRKGERIITKIKTRDFKDIVYDKEKFKPKKLFS